MQVLEDQHHRHPRGDRLDELHDLIDHAEPHVGSRRRCTRVQGPSLTREQPTDGHPARVRRPRSKIQRVRDHAEGAGSLKWVAAPPENGCTARAGLVPDLLNKPGLTKPSLALDQQHRRRAANDVLDELSRNR